ncbi:TonB family protein [Aurantimonas sp. MSK8Z-1]|uniref:energy transducer TonB family protein n=1 Tax=Mangrovibrevibacter kandeliae TaxID=2968473 RepID=UPI00211758D0|nr:TonB family protein [Aurantimonas sp. MSK8Z-1]MCW4116645.1 TonB family protein [Aurantimonas sp. MSK8Z-1]
MSAFASLRLVTVDHALTDRGAAPAVVLDIASPARSPVTAVLDATPSAPMAVSRPAWRMRHAAIAISVALHAALAAFATRESAAPSEVEGETSITVSIIGDPFEAVSAGRVTAEAPVPAEAERPQSVDAATPQTVESTSSEPVQAVDPVPPESAARPQPAVSDVESAVPAAVAPAVEPARPVEVAAADAPTSEPVEAVAAAPVEPLDEVLSVTAQAPAEAAVLPAESPVAVAETTAAPPATAAAAPVAPASEAIPVEAVSDAFEDDASVPLDAEPVQPTDAVRADAVQPVETAEPLEALAPVETLTAEEVATLPDEGPLPTRRPPPPERPEPAKAAEPRPQPRRTAEETPTRRAASRPASGREGKDDADSRRGSRDGGGTTASRESGRGRSGEGEAALSTYRGVVQRRIRRAAASRRGSGRGTATVNFTITGSGAIGGIRLVGSSGDAGLDRDALALVRAAGPFPAIPEAIGRSSLTFAIPLDFGR